MQTQAEALTYVTILSNALKDIRALEDNYKTLRDVTDLGMAKCNENFKMILTDITNFNERLEKVEEKIKILFEMSYGHSNTINKIVEILGDKFTYEDDPMEKA